MVRDERVVRFGEDVQEPGGGVNKMSKGFHDRDGTGRVRRTPISESLLVGMGSGAALTGLCPIAELTLCDFLGIALARLGNLAAKLRHMTGGAVEFPLTDGNVTGIGRGFGAQHSQSTAAELMHIPGITMVVRRRRQMPGEC